MNINYKSPGALEETRFEKIHSVIFNDSKQASKIVAQEIADLIKNKQKQNKNCVLGLATGSSPISVYQELVRMHIEEGLSFKNVITFNLDEYFPMDKDDINSYHHFMSIHLFDHIDIDKKNIHIPNGKISKEKIKESHRASYERNKELIRERGFLYREENEENIRRVKAVHYEKHREAIQRKDRERYAWKVISREFRAILNED